MVNWSEYDPEKILMWTPRFICIALCLVLLVRLFIKIGFSVNPLVPLMPIMIFILALIAAWRWPLAGGMAYILLGTAYFALSVKVSEYLVGSATAIPALLAGIIFILDWNRRVR